MLQRQIMFKQLEELQRQKKLQELNDSRQQNVINQQHSLLQNKQSGGQFGPLINGTPVRDPSQMFMFGNNSNLIQGFQNQVLNNPMSLDGNGISISTPAHGFSRFSNLHGTMAMDSFNKSSMSDQFNVPEQQGDYGGKISDTNTTNDEFTSLDPLEQKFLFNSDDNNFGSMFEDTDNNNNNNSQSFPSLQSGSWSALMQSALDETSSTDTGIQEEWSGLSFQNPEPSIDNNIYQNTPTSNSRPFPSTSFHLNQQFQKEGGDIVDTSTGFPIQDSNAQTSRHMLELLHKVDKFREFKHGQQSSYSESTLSKTPKAETPSNNSFVPQLKLSPSSQRTPPNYFDSSQAATSHFKNQESQQVSNSKSQPNVWVDIPSQQNLSEPQKDSELINSQTFDHGRGQDGKFPSGEESFSGRVEANGSYGHFGKQSQSHISPHGYSPLNPTYTGSRVKREKVDSDHKFPQVTSMSALTSAYENYKTVLASSVTKENNLVKSPFYPPVQDPSHKNSSFVQVNLANTSQYGTNSVIVNQDLIMNKSKKRKFPTYELLPWHKEATEGSRRLHDTRIAEVEWGQAANRVPEQIKEGGEVLKKRIILTTQLMQVLFRPPPTKILLEDSMECYEMVTYFAARLSLGDACSLVNNPQIISDTSLGKKGISKGSGDENLLKIVEDFIDRTKKIEDVISRLENGGSVLEIRMESQDLERFSVINRFAKFHSRAQMMAAADITTTTTTTSGGGPKLYPQRYVAACPMPRVVPEGHNCLSL